MLWNQDVLLEQDLHGTGGEPNTVGMLPLKQMGGGGGCTGRMWELWELFIPIIQSDPETTLDPVLQHSRENLLSHLETDEVQQRCYGKGSQDDRSGGGGRGVIPSSPHQSLGTKP